MIVNPSEVRARVLAEHDWLRNKLAILECYAAAVQRGQVDEAEELREATEDFCRSLLLHMATEDELLVPLLRDLDGWGDVRAEGVQSDHQNQRLEIAQLRRDAAVVGPATLAEAILTFARALRADMESEEEISLSPNILRDDIVSIAQLDG